MTLRIADFGLRIEEILVSREEIEEISMKRHNFLHQEYRMSTMEPAHSPVLRGFPAEGGLQASPFRAGCRRTTPFSFISFP